MVMTPCRSQGGSSTSVLFDLAGGTNYASATQDVITSSIYGGTGNDTLTFSSAAEVSGGKFGGAAGNDSISFGAALTQSGVSVIGGAGGDTLNFGANVTGASIAGGLGNDSILFTLLRLPLVHRNTYFYEGGTDTLAFASQMSQTSGLITFNTLSGAYTTVTTSAVGTTGINVVANGTTTIAFVDGTSYGGTISLGTYTSTAYSDLTTLG